MRLYYLFLAFCLFHAGSAVKTVQDDDLMNLIRTESYVITLFSSKNCGLCDNLENILTNLEEEFTKSFEGKTVKVLNSQLTRLYSPTKEPVLVFFRHGIPLLYNGVASEELILHTFQDNKEPVVKELNDNTFEHLTQAATGATTGDWFVMFYTPDCVECHRLQAVWETVGAQLKTRVNFARVNKATDGAATAERFGVSQAPTFILFRKGKMYKYQLQKYDIPSFASFAQDWYKNVTPLKVPLPKTTFDKVVEIFLMKMTDNAITLKIGLAACILAFLMIIVFMCGKTKKPRKLNKKE